MNSLAVLFKDTLEEIRQSRFLQAALVVLIVTSVTAVVQFPVLSSQAVTTDDNHYLIHNPLVNNPGFHSAGLFFSEVLQPSTVGGYYQPLTMVSLMLDCAVSGGTNNLFVYHLTNLALHILNTMILSLILFRIFKNPLAAALAGIFFGIHPIHVESLAWVSERKTLLATFFAFLSILFYIRYTAASRLRYYWASLALFLLALLSKPTVTPLPFVLVLLDFWPLKRFRWRTLIDKTPFLAVGILSGVLTVLSQANTAALSVTSWADSLLTVCYGCMLYPVNIFFPAWLSFFYPYPDPFSLANPVLVLCVAGTVILAVLLIVSLRWARAFAAGWSIFFLSLLPAMGIIGFTIVIACNKYVYFPMTGMVLVLCAAFTRLWESPLLADRLRPQRIILAALVAAYFIFETVQTRYYLSAWRDSETLARFKMAEAPSVAILHTELGIILSEKGQYDEAEKNLLEAARLDPGYPPTFNSLGVLMNRQTNYTNAVGYFLRALSLKGDYIDALDNLAYAYVQLNQYPEALAAYLDSIKYQPSDDRTRFSAGVLLFYLSRYDEAMEQLMQSVNINPGNAYAYYFVGRIYAVKNDPILAAGFFQKALSIDPGLQRARAALDALHLK